MSFCYYHVFVIKCLSLIAGCNPGSPFPSCVPLLKAAGFWAVGRDVDTELTEWWRGEGEQIFEDRFNWDFLSGAAGVRHGKGRAVSPTAGDPAIALLATVWLQNKGLFCIPQLHASTEAESWGSQGGEFCEPFTMNVTMQKTKHISPSLRLDSGMIVCLTTSSCSFAGWGSIFMEGNGGREIK